MPEHTPHHQKNRGVVYLFCGMAAAERLAVSLHSLRQWWKHSITVGCTSEEEMGLVSLVRRDMDVHVKEIPHPKGNRNRHYFAKTSVPTWAPYERTIFLDADTLVVGDITELFDHPLTITSFAEWQTFGRKVSKRIKEWTGKSPAIDSMVARQLAESFPAINTGVFGFWKENTDLALWHRVCEYGAGEFISDEVAMQLLSQEIDCRILDDRWNCSPWYGLAARERPNDVRVWHFHGRKHLRKKEGQKIWLPAFEECYRKNFGGLQEWAGQHDKWVRGWMKEHGTSRT